LIARCAPAIRHLRCTFLADVLSGDVVTSSLALKWVGFSVTFSVILLCGHCPPGPSSVALPI
jgi:hypothetical protein